MPEGKSTLRLVCNWLTEAYTQQQLIDILKQKLLVLQFPIQLIEQTNAAIKFAGNYEDSAKMYLLLVKLNDVLQENRQTKAEWDSLSSYVNDMIANWNDDIKIIPEDWIFKKEVFTQDEYGVNGIQYSETWTGIDEIGHWLMPIGRVVEISTDKLGVFFNHDAIYKKLSEIISRVPIQKVIFRIKLENSTLKKVKLYL